jgi:small subunit ribosomal protein S20
LPHHKSAKKRLKTSEERRLRNRTNRAQLRSSVKEFRRLIAGGANEGDQPVDLSRMYSLLDLQARKGIIHPNKAARLKSRLAGLSQK